MIQYLEAFLFLFIPLFAWGLISHTLLIRDKINLDTSHNELRASIQEKINLIPVLNNFLEQHLPIHTETHKRLKESGDNIEMTTDVRELVDTIKILEKEYVAHLTQIEEDKNIACQQQFIDIKHLLTDIDIRIQGNLKQYDLAAKYLNIRLGTFPANLIAKFFRIKMPLRINDIL